MQHYNILVLKVNLHVGHLPQEKDERCRDCTSIVCLLLGCIRYIKTVEYSRSATAQKLDQVEVEVLYMN